VDGGGHSSTQRSPLGQGAVGEQDCVVQWRVVMLRHVPPGGVGHRSVQISFGIVHGWRGEQSWSVYRPSTVMKHFPVGGGGGHSGTHSWFAGQGAVGEHEPPHCAFATSRHVPLGSGGGHTGTQISESRNAPSAEQGWSNAHDPLHCPVVRLKQVPDGGGCAQRAAQNAFGIVHGADGLHA